MKPLDTKQLQFFMDEVLGELNWGDEDDASGIDPLDFVRNEIRDMRKKITRLQGSLELREAAQQSFAADGVWTCPSCKSLQDGQPGHCDVCGTFTPRR